MRRLTERELDRLDSFFLRLEGDDAPLLSTADGLLAGVIVCPEMIMPSEWLPKIWGGEGSPAFESEHEANEILGLLMTRYNEIIHDLGKGSFEPIMDIDRDETELWELWMEGFAAAMALRRDSWAAYEAVEDNEVKTAFRRLTELADLSLVEDASAIDAQEEIGRHASELIAACLETLNAARLKMHPEPPTAASIRVGRNDPCPCGSGKKFKKCCMN